MTHRLAPEAETDLDEIWYYIARQSSSVEVADRVVDSITKRFSVIAAWPQAGRPRDADLRPGVRSFAAGEYVIIYRIESAHVVILRVLRGNRDIESIIRH